MLRRPTQAVLHATHPSINRMNLVAKIRAEAHEVGTRVGIEDHVVNIAHQRTILASRYTESSCQHIE